MKFQYVIILIIVFCQGGKARRLKWQKTDAYRPPKSLFSPKISRRLVLEDPEGEYRRCRLSSLNQRCRE